MQMKIYAMTHKKFEIPKDPMYIPLQVGREGKEDLGYLSDNTGDQISEKNRYFSELTGIYWVYKNACDADYLGVCHYRRYPLDEKGYVLSKKEYEKIFEQYDIVTSKLIELRFPYYDGYKADHHIEDLQALEQVIREKYPEYYDNFELLVHKNRTYFGNIMVASKEVFEAYHSWLFNVLFELEKKIQGHLDGADYDDYHRRVYGFLSEFLMTVWIYTNKLKVYETKIGIIAEKAETRELKEKLAASLEKGEIEEAKQLFLEARKSRPDLLMEVSDITGELKLTMQIIAIAELEMKEYGTCFVQSLKRYSAMIHFCNRLDLLTEHYRTGSETIEDREALKILAPSETAIRASSMVCCEKDPDFTAERILKEWKKCQIP